MKKIIIAALSLATLAVWLNVGYYKYYGVHDTETFFFIKKHPTLQIKFMNLAASDQDPSSFSLMDDEEKEWLMDYCKYRLGIITKIESQSDVEKCLDYPPLGQGVHFPLSRD
ncbi:hypothetical protein [Halomonas binhaiensis]|uniref:Uncharacterized protein n=1 Tax=Halomonas binhaiensis TaxID=2562282 RepID=A0A5C1NM48_9GAMM|nr:hypothetical protein [Halomonas binhaiensis]QEM83771.1 hypothetical protein E4T21_21010 [Halomonas binhaiensis]